MCKNISTFPEKTLNLRKPKTSSKNIKANEYSAPSYLNFLIRNYNNKEELSVKYEKHCDWVLDSYKMILILYTAKNFNILKILMRDHS